MISDVSFIILILAVVVTTAFMVVTLRRENFELIHKLYFGVLVSMLIWIIPLIIMRYVDEENQTLLYILDSIMYTPSFVPVLVLLVSMTFVKGYNKLPRWVPFLFIIPTITPIVVWSNPLHHLFYRVFSLRSDQLEFGPYIYVSGSYSYICLGLSIYIMVRFAFRHHNGLYMRQAIAFSVGSLAPMLVSFLATSKLVPFSIVATPVSFVVTIIFHGLAIFRFHMLDIKPIALQWMLNWISDCYLVISDKDIVVSFNQPFNEIFGEKYGIRENVNLRNCLEKEDVGSKNDLYNLLASIDSSRNSNSRISYEQAILLPEGENYKKKYYMVDITPLVIEEKMVGFVIFFKDVSRVKESMQKLQDSQARLMEQERLASLGQMVGGIAHNLKTPIMSISGSSAAVDNLVNECRASIGDPEVTPEDFYEIYEEMQDWLHKVREACAYMSDIITAVKGQAAHMSTSDDAEFSTEDLLKRVFLLLRHELVGSGCGLIPRNTVGEEVFIRGDINSMVQVVNNLISNAIDAQKAIGGNIYIDIDKDETALMIRVVDHGSGVPEDVKKHLFRQMVTSKGTFGTGLGVFISNSIIKGKFGGHMWYQENPAGGSIFGISIPLEYVEFGNHRL